MMSVKEYTEAIKSALLGVAVGDALGVPVEFSSREELREEPVTDMLGGAGTTYGQLAGTWSDDSSLTFCLAESLTRGFDLNDIATLFRQWRYNDYWTARGAVFDVGHTTRSAINRLEQGVQPDLAGDTGERSNGNGSLMRILPLLFYLADKPERSERFAIIKQVSSITHGHIRSVIACFYYLEFARQMLEGKEIHLIYKNLQEEIPAFLNEHSISQDEISLFDRLLTSDIGQLPEREIRSSGYVVHTLEASIWCLLTTGSYEEAVLKAVNLGGDTDTTAAVAGGLAGLLYGTNNIPGRWLQRLARREDIERLAEQLAERVNK
ncbi:MAG: ADP-ribosylglycohydrolase family protein [Tannerellaceae bacterium]|jgi:ADP-ribosylglycohydrolase|nr:ADP-ribosylglycohydrolase family protein [Tannerellaceae bacterium]